MSHDGKSYVGRSQLMYRTAWRAILIGLAALLAAIGIFAQPQTDKPSVATPPTSRVLLTGQLARSYVRVGDRARFWITIDNQGSTELSEVRLLHVDSPGFATWAGCWYASPDAKDCGEAAANYKSCVGANASADKTLLCPVLPAGHSVTVWGELLASDAELEHINYAIIGWTQNGQPSSANVSLGPSRTVSWWWSWFVRLTGRPDLMVSVVLTILGLFAAWIASGRQERAQTWNAMLLQSHADSMHYHMPAASTLTAATHWLSKYRESLKKKASAPAQERELQLAFYYFCMFQWWYLETYRQVGAFHFKSETSELILRTLYGQHKRLMGLDSPGVHRRLDDMLELLNKSTSLSQFLQLLGSRKIAVNRAWKLYRRWTSRADTYPDEVVLVAYRKLLVYEVNRILLHWYGTIEPLDLTQEEEAEILAIMAGQEQSQPGVGKRVADYLKTCRFERAEGARGLWLRIKARL